MEKKVQFKEPKSKLSKKTDTFKVSRNKKSSNVRKKKVKTSIFNKFINKINATYFLLFLLDIILVIYSAKQNIVNYVKILDQDVFVSKTSYLLFGRNYINLIITIFFYLYICLINRFFLQRKNTKRFLLWLLIGIVFLNLILFFCFTKRVY